MQPFPAYHAHVYFNADSYAAAEALCTAASDQFAIPMGRLHRKPVGPHPAWSCQLSFPAQLFAEIIPWLNFHRNGLDILIHPVTDNALKDHSEYTMWLGHSYELDLSIFK
ncbi:MAG: 4,5-dioxygenase [Neptuniibacter caesariensis]|uniref:4,5-dioxygenase n=1 Tax=Neptuniibacter caesariensis TaxID=207954 RepID=A0A2G6JR53_NEPCE|nr:MAG: 4,5-dioxygenase [Neptuniibacter caesariensis]